MKRQTLQAINEARRAGRAIVRASDLATGEEMLIDPATDTSPLGLAAAGAARADTSGPAQIEGRSWFLSVFNPPLDLVIVGAVHIAQPLIVMASETGYGVRMIDPRTAFATPERFPDVKVIAQWPDVALPPLAIDRYTAFVALTHDPKIDDPALVHALAKECFYVGALGSRKTHARRRERLSAHGMSEAALARIHAPIGLAIGAVSPPEIAVAIIGEITASLRLAPAGRAEAAE